MCLTLFSQIDAADPKAKSTDEQVIFYLHGRIIEDQGPGAESDRFGRYEYEAILKSLSRNGHRVVSEVRKPKTDVWSYARKIAADIEELKSTGLPSKDITVVGASKGAAIAVLVSHLVRDARINYVLLAICGTRMLEYWDEENVCITGNVLSIYETSDELASSCVALADRCSDRITSYEEIELSLGVGHGMLYKPREQWVAPALEWTRKNEAVQQAAEPDRP